MSDIVERLRKLAGWLREVTLSGQHADWCDEAAAEILSLREGNRKLHRRAQKVESYGISRADYRNAVWQVVAESGNRDAPALREAELLLEIRELRQQVEKARAMGRDEGLEEAAVKVMTVTEPGERAPAFMFADAIRALKSGEGA